jgi:RimJ/RimL family protein N-acetyltransferase
VGTALLRTWLPWAEANPLLEKIGLEVFATHDRATRCYKKLGFVEEGLRPKQIKLRPGRYADTVAMYQFVKQQPFPAPPPGTSQPQAFQPPETPAVRR